jgi:hypothetical protein
MSEKGFKVWGSSYGYEKDKGAHVFAIPFTGNTNKDRASLLAGIKAAEAKYDTKITIMGVGESVQGPLRDLAKKYIPPDWKVPRNQIHFAFPAGKIIEVEPAEPPASKPASPPPARHGHDYKRKKKAKSKKTKATPEVKNGDTIAIQSDLWEALKKLGG